MQLANVDVKWKYAHMCTAMHYMNSAQQEAAHLEASQPALKPLVKNQSGPAGFKLLLTLCIDYGYHAELPWNKLFLREEE